MKAVDNLQIWQNFVEVQKAGSVYAASQMLDVDVSLLGRQILKLEQELGVELLNRKIKPALLTEAGEIAVEKARRLLALHKDLISAVRENPEKMEGRIILACSRQIASTIVTPRIVQFQTLYPKVEFELRTLTKNALETIKNPKSDVMVAIGFGHKSDDEIYSKYLGSVRLISCASYAYLDKYGFPKHPSELINHILITYPNLLDKPLLYLHSGEQKIKIQAKKTIKFTDPMSAKRALLLGAGCIVATGISLFLEELKSGQLVRIFESWQPSSMETYIYATPAAWKLRRIREFVSWWADPTLKREYFINETNENENPG